MYGEDYGTSTLAKSLISLSKNVYHDMDDGIPYEDLLENAKWLMEGAVTPLDVIRVLLLATIGNMVGGVAFAWLVRE